MDLKYGSKIWIIKILSNIIKILSNIKKFNIYLQKLDIFNIKVLVIVCVKFIKECHYFPSNLHT